MSDRLTGSDQFPMSVSANSSQMLLGGQTPGPPVVQFYQPWW